MSLQILERFVNLEGGKALLDWVVVFVLCSPGLLMFLQRFGTDPSSRENLYRSLFWDQLDAERLPSFTVPCTLLGELDALNIHPNTSAKNSWST